MEQGDWGAPGIASVLLCPQSDLEKEAPPATRMHPPLLRRPRGQRPGHLPIQMWEELRKRTSWRQQRPFRGPEHKSRPGVLLREPRAPHVRDPEVG